MKNGKFFRIWPAVICMLFSTSKFNYLAVLMSLAVKFGICN